MKAPSGFRLTRSAQKPGGRAAVLSELLGMGHQHSVGVKESKTGLRK